MGIDIDILLVIGLAGSAALLFGIARDDCRALEQRTRAVPPPEDVQ